jgi:hypothetical protein
MAFWIVDQGFLVFSRAGLHMESREKNGGSNSRCVDFICARASRGLPEMKQHLHTFTSQRKKLIQITGQIAASPKLQPRGVKGERFGTKWSALSEVVHGIEVLGCWLYSDLYLIHGEKEDECQTEDIPWIYLKLSYLPHICMHACVRAHIQYTNCMILRMEEILHQLIGGLSQYLLGFNHRCRISSVHSMSYPFIYEIVFSMPPF